MLSKHAGIAELLTVVVPVDGQGGGPVSVSVCVSVYGIAIVTATEVKEGSNATKTPGFCAVGG